jgi:hydrogenase maturation protease
MALGSAPTVAPLLVFACGNPSRGDDALGPAFLEMIGFGHSASQDALAGTIDLLCDYQLQVEHTLDLLGRRQIVFADASASVPAPFAWQDLKPERDASYSSHAVSPRALLQAFADVFGYYPPPAKLLAIRGYEFELGEGLSPEAKRNLEEAASFFGQWLNEFILSEGFERAACS